MAGRRVNKIAALAVLLNFLRGILGKDNREESRLCIIYPRGKERLTKSQERKFFRAYENHAAKEGVSAEYLILQLPEPHDWPSRVAKYTLLAKHLRCLDAAAKAIHRPKLADDVIIGLAKRKETK